MKIKRSYTVAEFFQDTSFEDYPNVKYLKLKDATTLFKEILLKILNQFNFEILRYREKLKKDSILQIVKILSTQLNLNYQIANYKNGDFQVFLTDDEYLIVYVFHIAQTPSYNVPSFVCNISFEDNYRDPQAQIEFFNRTDTV